VISQFYLQITIEVILKNRLKLVGVECNSFVESRLQDSVLKQGLSLIISIIPSFINSALISYFTLLIDSTISQSVIIYPALTSYFTIT